MTVWLPLCANDNDTSALAAENKYTAKFLC